MSITSRKSGLVLGTLSNAFYDLPVSVNLNIWWNFGSCLGLCLVIQIVSGISLAMHYVPHVDLAYDSVIHIMRDVNHGWVLRSVHANGASFFFLCVYAHIGRGIYYGSYQLVGVWISGVFLLILLMATAFIGYVLPWGQISYWGAVVITNMVTVIPYVGNDLLYWIWGGYAVGQATLLRFYVFHFLFPFFIALMVVVHLVYLHKVGGNNPLGIYSPGDDIPFHPYYTYNDLVGFSILSWAMAYVCLLQPDLFAEPENYNKANPLITPAHIQPEWYFLFAYAILRSVPTNTGGVVALVGSILVLLTLPISAIGYYGCLSSSINPLNQVLFWFFVGNFCLLTWLGSCPIDEPYVSIGLNCTKAYFSFFFVYPVVIRVWWCFLGSIGPDGRVDMKCLIAYPTYVWWRFRYFMVIFLWGVPASKNYNTWYTVIHPADFDWDPHEFPVRCSELQTYQWRRGIQNWVNGQRTYPYKGRELYADDWY